MITAKKFVQQAIEGKYLGIPYSKLDCQGFVEKVLADCGEKHDWRGSNHMWRDALNEKNPITSWVDVPAGAWLFVVKNDGGEKKRGYNDAEGNACHVGIFLGAPDIIHSTTGGVQMDNINSKRWTHWGKCKYILYEEAQPSILDALRLIGEESLFDIYQACKTLWG